MKPISSIKIPFTFSSKKKHTLVQICFPNGGAEGTRTIKASAMEKRAGPVRTLEPCLPGHQGKGNDSCTVALLAGGRTTHLCVASWRTLFSLFLTKWYPLGGKGISFLHQLFQYPCRISNDTKTRKKTNAIITTAFHTIHPDHSSTSTHASPCSEKVQYNV